MHLNSMLRRGISLLDRTNSVGVRDCLLVCPSAGSLLSAVHVCTSVLRTRYHIFLGICLSAHAHANVQRVQVQTRVPAGSIQTAGAAFSLFDESAGSTDLAVVVQSDFQEVRLPLKVHGGASWVVSDLAYLRSKAWQHLRPRRL